MANYQLSDSHKCKYMYLITRIPNLIQFQGDFTELRDYQIIIFFFAGMNLVW